MDRNLEIKRCCGSGEWNVNVATGIMYLTIVSPSSIGKKRKSDEKHSNGNDIGQKLSILIPEVLKGILWIDAVNERVNNILVNEPSAVDLWEVPHVAHDLLQDSQMSRS